MTKWLIVLACAVAVAGIGCKSQEEQVQVYDQPSAPMSTPGPPQGQPKSTAEGINSNPNIPEVAKKALGTKK